MTAAGAAIRLLAPQVADAIAAGEVVERPAAVVKELCENALDAGATRIDVEMEGGGLVRIAVSDNGAGIPGDQLPLAVARHATSKVTSIDDLAAVRSLGFRGEALASIAAVSELVLTSRVADGDSGWELVCRGGDVVAHRPRPRAPGTTAEARDLFHNTPARLAFLRAERSEAAACVRAVSDLALTHPGVAFACRTGRRLALRTPGGTLRDAAAAVYGGDAGELLEVAAVGDIAIAGLISEPRAHRGTRAGLVLVLNGRRVHNRALVAAVEQAYAGLLPTGRHPFGVVAVELDPSRVDVNVHPTKREVRLRDEGRVFLAVQRACWSTLQDAHLRAAPARAALGSPPAGAAQAAALEVRDGSGARPAPGWGPRSTGPPGHGPAWPAVAGGAPVWPVPWAGAPAVREGGGDLAGADGPTGFPAAGPVDGDRRLAELAPLLPLTQSADGWLVADSPRGLCLVDPHAAHERVLYALLLAAAEEAASRASAGPSQPLLFEATVSVEPAAAERVTGSTELLREVGFDLEPFGPGLVRCRAVPAAAGPRDPQRLVRELLDALAEPEDAAARRHRLAALTACHAAVRLGDRLGAREQARLLEQLVGTPGGLTCPHGRPTLLLLDDRWLRRAFGRPAV